MFAVVVGYGAVDRILFSIFPDVFFCNSIFSDVIAFCHSFDANNFL